MFPASSRVADLKKPARVPQIKVTIPPAEMPDIREAMEWDGLDELSRYALAGIRQRTQRILRSKKRELAAEIAEDSARKITHPQQR